MTASVSTAILAHVEVKMLDLTNMTPVTERGVTWLVSESGEIYSPARAKSVSRVRLGKAQEFVSRWEPKPLAQCRTQSGYLEVACVVDGKRVKAAAHRIIGKAFVPGYEDGLSINHINGVKTDNRPENLEWLSLSDNTRHQWATGLVDLRGDNCPGRKLSAKKVKIIRQWLRAGIPANQIATVTDLSASTISKIENGQRWSSITGSS